MITEGRTVKDAVPLEVARLEGEVESCARGSRQHLGTPVRYKKHLMPWPSTYAWILFYVGMTAEQRTEVRERSFDPRTGSRATADRHHTGRAGALCMGYNNARSGPVSARPHVPCEAQPWTVQTRHCSLDRTVLCAVLVQR